MEPLDRARSLESVDAARALYDDWAERYDADVFEQARVIGSDRIADLLAEHLDDRSTPIVDLGCGTGAVGRRLAQHGFTDLTGIDLSPGMLAVAERTGAYHTLIEADLNQPVDVVRRFGASVSAGTFTTGHVPAVSARHLLAMLLPAATIAWVVAPTLWPDFESTLTEAGVEIHSGDAEPIRAGAADLSHMLIGGLGRGQPIS
jgi:SAM-dependent methyltransferase